MRRNPPSTALCQQLLTISLALLPALAAQGGEAPIVLRGPSVYYGLPVPQEVQALTLNADLNDIQVLNARGETVPFAWAEPAAELSASQHQTVPFFKAPPSAKPPDPATSTPASKANAEAQNNWILDTRKTAGSIVELALTLTAGATGVYAFAIEASADLQQWSTVQEAAQLVVLQHQGLRLDHTHFPLDGVRAAYLRLRPLAGSAAPPLATVAVSSLHRQAAVAPMQWSPALKPTQCTPQYCDYVLPRHFAAERMQWLLADANTLAPVQVLAQPDADAYTRPEHAGRRHGLRNHIRELRGKTATEPSHNTSEPPWFPLSQTTLYWLQLPQAEVRTPASVLTGELYAKVRLQPTGGMVQLGTRPPELRVGARVPALFFLAREPAPYRLSWGSAKPAPALSLAELMPTRKDGDALPENTAVVTWPPASAVAPQAVASSPPTQPVTKPPQKLWLWGILALALGLMGAMAWSLLKPRPR
jgi:hypothetical protein